MWGVPPVTHIASKRYVMLIEKIFHSNTNICNRENYQCFGNILKIWVGDWIVPPGATCSGALFLPCFSATLCIFMHPSSFILSFLKFFLLHPWLQFFYCTTFSLKQTIFAVDVLSSESRVAQAHLKFTM